jgi:SAM-dependent methyltransferase
MDNTYDSFSKYYRELIYSSGHFKAEKEVIIQIIKNFAGDNYKNRIMDAACGTGDALFEVFNCGYSNIVGLDGSAKMIERAKELLPRLIFFNIKWENIPEIFHTLGQYNLIFLISMSLPHAQKENIPIILKHFYDILYPGGTLIFDNRMWITDENSTLIEKARPIGVFHNLRKIIVDNFIYTIDDKCEYINDRQYITYRIRKDESWRDEMFLPVDYARISSYEYLKILSSIGFLKSNTYLHPNWPYELIYAIK